MGFSMSEVLHVISQAIMNPVLAVLFFLVIVSVWQVGDVLMEFILERRKRCRDVPALLQEMHRTPLAGLPEFVADSSFLKNQKGALQKLLGCGDISRAEAEVTAQRILADEEQRYSKIMLTTDMVAKLGPMFGLLGTLIPLGPGIIALGQGDTATLAASLGVAFDTTVIGVICAAICSVISRVRRGWYEDYLSGLEAGLEYILEAAYAEE